MDVEGQERTAGPGRARRAPTYRSLLAVQPWRRGESLLSCLLAAIGVAGWVTCWVGVSGKLVWRDQLPWMVSGALFTVLFVLSGAVWLAVGMGRVRAGFRALAAGRTVVYDLDRGDLDVSVATMLAGSTELVTSASMTRVHRPDCLLMRGKEALPISTEGGTALPGCGVCGT